jgi:cytochrome c peroxidase
MKSNVFVGFSAVALFIIFQSCSTDEVIPNPFEAIQQTFAAKIDLENLPNYASQVKPVYITKDNITTNPISDKGALLGRVLFYDKNLSADKKVACASCHKQVFGFSDVSIASPGVNGNTTRHAMRLINARFSLERKFFWDERAATLEVQTTQPIQNHAEMGYSGVNGDPSINDLIARLKDIDYYQELFTFVYGDQTISEVRLQECLSQFVRSIQSFDSRYDAGRIAAGNDNAPFANFSTLENQGKNIFNVPPQFDATGNRVGGGAGCGGCHRPPEFDIDPNTRNNGVIGTLAGGIDLTVTRAPSLRDLLQVNGTSNGPLMHTGFTNDLVAVINHYNEITAIGNTNLDPRLRPGGNLQKLHLTQAEIDGLVAFLKTLSGSNVYTDTKWSDPF